MILIDLFIVSLMINRTTKYETKLIFIKTEKIEIINSNLRSVNLKIEKNV